MSIRLLIAFFVTILCGGFTSGRMSDSVDKVGEDNFYQFDEQAEKIYNQLDLTDKVSIKPFFPYNHDKKLYFGEDNELLLSIKNLWEKSITVFSLTASYRQPSNMNTLTDVRILMEIKPGQEATLLYKIKPDMLQPQLGFHLVVDYTDDEKKHWFKAIGYNDIISVVEEDTSGFRTLITDPQLLFIVVIVVSLVGIMSLYMGRKIFGDQYFYKKTKVHQH